MRVSLFAAAMLAAVAASPNAKAQPADQRAFAAVNESVQPRDGQETPIQGIERKLEARDKAACKAMPKEIHDWVGRVSYYDRGKTGNYSIQIEIGRKVFVTQEIDMAFLLRDTKEQRAESDEQLALAKLLPNIRQGDRVVFSGRFHLGYYGNGKCPIASNFLIVSRHDKPDYWVRIRTISKL